MRTIKSFRWVSQLVFLSTIILCIGCLPVVLTDPIPSTLLSKSYFLLIYVSQNFLLSVLLGLVLLPLFLLVKSDRVRIVVAVIPVTAFLMFCIANAKVFSFWRFYVNQVVFDLFFDKGGRGNVFQVSGEMVIFILLAVLFILLLSVLVIAFAEKIAKRFSVTFPWFLLLAIYVLAQSTTLFLITRQNVSYLQYVFKSPYFMDFSWASLLDRMGVRVFPKAGLSSQLRHVLSERSVMQYPLHPLQYQASEKRPLNVLFIVLDSLRFDMINQKNMPNVYAFSKSTDQFVNHISGGDCTSAGVFTMFYGIPVTYWDSAITHHQGAVMIRAFQDNDYQLKLLGSAGFLSPAFYRTVFASVKQLTLLTPGETPWARDEAITTDMQAFLDRQKKQKTHHKPFFGFLFYDSPHAYSALGFQRPFVPASSMNYVTVSNHTDPAPIFHLYENAVFAADRLVGRLLQTLKTDDLLKNTVVIITSDHGQEFNEYHNNYWEHPSGFSQYQLRTPLLIAWPGRQPTTIHYRTTHFDLAPTLLKGVLHVKNPASDYSVGVDLYQPHDTTFAIIGQYGRYALVTKNGVMPFRSSGLYRFTDNRMQPADNKKQLNPTVREAMLTQMRRFFAI